MKTTIYEARMMLANIRSAGAQRWAAAVKAGDDAAAERLLAADAQLYIAGEALWCAEKAAPEEDA